MYVSVVAVLSPSPKTSKNPKPPSRPHDETQNTIHFKIAILVHVSLETGSFQAPKHHQARRSPTPNPKKPTPNPDHLRSPLPALWPTSYSRHSRHSYHSRHSMPVHSTASSE